jgi:SAM-dependent methyltransferase
MTDAHHHDHHGVDDDHGDGLEQAGALAEMLELDAEVHHGYLSDAISWVGHLARDRPTHRVVDLGCGTGTATIALARTFPDANVLAVDSSADYLARVRNKAAGMDANDRITTLQADLDGSWPLAGTVDVVWASMSLHHLADPDRTLADLYATVRPGGLVAVAEMDALPRFLPDDLGIGRPGLEARCHAALAEDRARQLPALGSDWGARLTGAGFTTVTERLFAIDADPPLPPAVGTYARLFLQRVLSQLDDTTDADDRDTLDALIDSDGPHSVLNRRDLRIRGTRTIWAATTPSVQPV